MIRPRLNTAIFGVLLSAVAPTKADDEPPYKVIKNDDPQGCEVALFHPNGKSLVWSSWGQSNVYLLKDVERAGSAEPATKVYQAKTNIRAMSFSPDGKLLAVATRTPQIVLLETDKYTTVQELKGHEVGKNRISDVWSISFSPDGQTLVSGGADATARVWNVQTGKQIAVLRKHTDEVIVVRFSPDGKEILTCGQDKKSYIWDTKTWKVSRPLDAGSVRFADYNRTGDAILTSSMRPEGVRIWDPKTCKELRGLETSGCGRIAIDPDGKIVAVADEKPILKDRAFPSRDVLKLYDFATGKQILAFAATTEGTMSSLHPLVAFSPDGKTLLYKAGTVLRLWDVSKYTSPAK